MTILNVSWKNGVFHDRKSWSADLLPSADTVLILTTACGSRRRSSMRRLCCSFGVTLTSRHYQPETCGSVYMGTSLPRLFPPPVFDLVSFPDPPEKQERDWCSEQHFLSHGVAFNKSGTRISKALVHMDYLLHSTVYKSLRWPQSLSEQPIIGCETSFKISKI